MKRFVVFAVFAVVTALTFLHAQRQPLRLEKVTDDFYVIFGNGGNTGVYVAEQGVVLVDTKFLPDAPEILEKVKSVTGKPVRYVINTHHHGDHCQGNPGMPAMIEIAAHENAARRMKESPFFKEAGREQFVAGRVYKERVSFLAGKDRIDVYYFGRGHTDGDSVIHFPRLKLVHMGDLFAGRGAPLIDVNGGGSGVAYPATLERVLKQFPVAAVEQVVPGHSPLLARKDLAEFAEFNGEVLKQVRQAVNENRAVGEIAVKLPAGKFSDYNLGRLKANVEAIYAELKK